LDEAVCVLDVGKTHAKLSLVGRDGRVRGARRRANAAVVAEGRAVLDADGTEAWALASLADAAREADIRAIVPVGHGAAAALVEGDRLAAPVMDYEVAPPAEVAAAYARERDDFAVTGSPRLPAGLNLGVQLFWQERLYPGLWPKRAMALPWAQYWAMRLSGEAASEATSLGCHTDLWRPHAGGWSALAERRGWAARFPALQRADAALGPARALGAPVLAGLHDSNASLNAARAFPEVAGAPFSLISTGTWFVTFQCGGGAEVALDPARDVLINVDVEGRPVPSARFMGGREYAAITGEALGEATTFEAMTQLVAAGVRTRPSFAPGGPFQGGQGAVVGRVGGPAERAALAALHLALMSDVDLGLVGAIGPIVIEGRFAADPIFAAVLAALRPDRAVYACPDGGDAVALGAARLVWPALAPAAPLRRVAPAPIELAAYAARWRAEALETSNVRPLKSASAKG